MRKYFFIFAAALLAALSCAKESEVENLQRQVDDLKSTEIATLNRQVENINSSLSSLEAADAEIRAYITVLQEKARDLEEADRTLTSRITEVREELSASITAEKQTVLDALNAYKSEIDGRLSAINASIASLEVKDASLQGQITDLKDYVRGDLKSYIDAGDSDVQVWVSATFTTLEQYQGLVGSIAGIRADISALNSALENLEACLSGKLAADLSSAVAGLEDTIGQKVAEITEAYTAAVATAKAEITEAYTAAIRSAIAVSEASMQSWVNEQLTGYYTIAEMDAKLAALERAIADGDAENAAEAGRLREEIAAAREELTTAYEQAIASAITRYDGEIKEHLSSQIAAVNARLAALEGRVRALEAAVLGLQQQIDDIKDNIIASINSQITGINASIGSLQATDTELQGYITALQEQVSALEAADQSLARQIASLEAELSGEISSEKQAVLNALAEYRLEAAGKLAAINSTIEALEAKDADLQQQIEALSEYVNTTLKAYIDGVDADSRAWVSATFATLTQYQGLVESIEGIRSDIASIGTALEALENTLGGRLSSNLEAALLRVDSTISQKVSEITEAYTSALATARTEITEAYTAVLRSAIASSEASMQSWVNTQLTGYATVAAADARIEALERLLEDGDAANAAEITRLSQELSSLREEITAAYTEAITEAITSYDGLIKEHLAEQIASVNARADALEERIAALETAVTGLRTDIDKLLGMIQSVVVIPDYSDGSVKCVPGVREYRFEVRPSGLATSLVEAGLSAFKMRAVNTITKTSPALINMPVSEVSAEGDILFVKASGENLGVSFFDGSGTASAQLAISSGVNAYQTGFFPLRSIMLDMEAVDLGLSVKWASCNIGASSPEEYGDYYAWCETYTKDNYTYDTYSLRNDLQTFLVYLEDLTYYTSYFINYDAAHASLGGEWRMPTSAELQELVEGCDSEWTTVVGVKGRRFTSRTNGNSIFLPAAGCKEGTALADDGTWGYYRAITTSATTDEGYGSPGIAFLSQGGAEFSYLDLSGSGLYLGFPIRAVVSPEAASVTLNETAITLTEGESTTLYVTVTPSNVSNPNVTWTSSNTSVATVSTNGKVTAKSVGEARITASCSGKVATCTVTVQGPPTISEVTSGAAVDMGLSVRWASCNLGASVPREYGNYYAWGETGPKSLYDWSTYRWGTGSQALTKYNTVDSYGPVDGKTSLDPEDDAARALLGGGWRMPTWDEMNELYDQTWTWVKFGGVKGYQVTSTVNGNTIFLPAAGLWDSEYLYDDGVWGFYWTSDSYASYRTAYPQYGIVVYFDAEAERATGYIRCYGLSIRPVIGSDAEIPVTFISLSQYSLSLTEGDSEALTATVSPSDATNKTVTWSSSDTSVASVTQSGVVTATGEGGAVINASCGELYAACTVTVQKRVVPVSSLTLNSYSLTLTEGDTGTLAATVNPSDATERTVSWTSSNSSVASVSQSGAVTAVSVGTASITATCGGKSATCAVTVQKRVIPVSSVTLSNTSITLTEEESAVLTATVNPSDATEQTVSWTSSNSAVASVSQGGEVSALAEGTATITASCGGKSATCAVTVQKKIIPVASILLSRTSITLTEGDSETVTAIVNPSDATDRTVTWSTSNSTVASVTQNGGITAISEGTATITASCGGKSATCAVIVQKRIIPVNSVTLDQSAATLRQNETLRLTATVNPSDATDRTVTWSTSNSAVASVSQDGLVTAILEGTATITASSGGKSASCVITVSNSSSGGNEGTGEENWD